MIQTRLGAQSGPAVGTLLGQHEIVRSLGGQPLEQVLVGLVVARLPQIVTGQLGPPQGEQQLPRS